MFLRKDRDRTDRDVPGYTLGETLRALTAGHRGSQRAARLKAYFYLLEMRPLFVRAIAREVAAIAYRCSDGTRESGRVRL